MENTQHTPPRSTTTIMRLEEALNICNNFNQSQVTRYSELHHCLNSLEKDNEKLLIEKEDLLRALELKQGQVDDELHEDKELRDNDEAVESVSVLPPKYEGKHAQLTSSSSNWEESKKKLQKEKEDLSSQVRALKSKQHQLNAELHEKEQQLRDKEDVVQSLKNSLQSQREDSGRRIDELQYAWMDEQYKRHEHMLNCVNGNHTLHSEVDALTSALQLKEDECENLKKDLRDKNEEIRTIWTNMERSRSELERMMVTKLEEAAEEKCALQCDYEQKLSQLISVVSSWEEDRKKLLKEKEDLSIQVRALKSSELNERTQLLRDSDVIQALESTLQSRTRETTRIDEMLYALGDHGEKHHEHMVDCVPNTPNPELQVDTISIALDLRKVECVNVKMQLQEKTDEVTTIRTKLERSKADLERSMADLESMMIFKLEEATEEKLAMQSDYEHLFKNVPMSPSG